MDAYIDRAFCHLAALTGVRDDCVPARALKDWPPPGLAVHGLNWSVHVVIEAISALMT